MVFKLVRNAGVAIYLMATTLATAQKAPQTHPLTITFPKAEASWLIRGNMRLDEESGRPLAIYGEQEQMPNADAETTARNWLKAHQALFQLTNADLNGLKLHAIAKRETGHTVRLRQTWHGLPVNRNAEITIHIGPTNRVDFVQNGFEYGIDLNSATPEITAADARKTVMQYLKPQSSIQFEKSELMVWHIEDREALVYCHTVVLDDPLGEWQSLVDAHTGQIITCEDVSIYHHHNNGEPSVPYARGLFATGTGNVFNPDPLSTANAAYGGTGYSDNSDANSTQLTSQVQSIPLNDITFNGTVYSLVGPYAEIQDFEAPNKGLFTQATSTFNFLRADDAFEAVNTYYQIDLAMRHLNLTLGVACVPYQYSTGVRFDPSGLSGADNSHYLGSTGRLAFGEGGVDDAEDVDVIIHELGHGMHDWITAGGLSQVNGLSEGTGDYWAASFSRSTGVWPTSSAAYHWTFNWDGHNPFWGGRVTNYAPIYPSGLVSQIHTDGQIWATANIKIWDDIGRNKTDKAFWLGLDMTNGSTNQNDAANAVYQAATTLGYTYAERVAMRNRYIAAGYTMPAAPLPVELVAFGARKSGNDAALYWETATESDSKNFIVEHSIDATQFQEVAQVAAAGESMTNKSYQAMHRKPGKGVHYYRLRQVDHSGAESLSGIASVQFSERTAILLYPNPVAQEIKFDKELSEDAQISVINQLGQVVLSVAISAEKDQSQHSIDLSGLPTGVYIFRLLSGTEEYTDRFRKL